MAALAQCQMSGIWFDRSLVEEAEYQYQQYLVRGSSVVGDKSVSKISNKCAKGDSKDIQLTVGLYESFCMEFWM